MAKTGFDYYSIDTDRYQDIRIKRLKRYNGCDGIAVYDYILCEIYRDKGYFLVWGPDSAFDVAEYFGIKETKVRGIIEFCAGVGLFNKVLLGSGVLTSASIQHRYIEMCGRSKRRPVILPEYNLLDDTVLEKTPLAKSAIENTESKQQSTPEQIIKNSPFVTELCKNEQWIELICMQHHLQPAQVQEWLYKFALDTQCAGVEHWNHKDTMSHFNAWLKKEIDKTKTINEQRKTGRRIIAAGEAKDYSSSF